MSFQAIRDDFLRIHASGFLNIPLIKDLEKRLGTRDLFCWLEEEAESLSKLGLRRRDDIFVALTQELLQARNIIDVRPADGIAQTAYIEPKNDGYVIYYKKGLPHPHRRFAIAHEIGHTLWFTPGGVTRPLSPMQLNRHRDKTIEFLCNRYAAALLMPRALVKKFLQEHQWGEHDDIPPLHLIPLLAERFAIWEQAAARRVLFELYPTPVSIVCAQQTVVKSRIGHQEKSVWKLRWCAIPPHAGPQNLAHGYAIPFKTSTRIIPDDMVPDLPVDKTFQYQLDSRWWEAIHAQPQTKVHKPLKFRARGQLLLGHACRIHDRLYLALPLTTSF